MSEKLTPIQETKNKNEADIIIRKIQPPKEGLRLFVEINDYDLAKEYLCDIMEDLERPLKAFYTTLFPSQVEVIEIVEGYVVTQEAKIRHSPKVKVPTYYINEEENEIAEYKFIKPDDSSWDNVLLTIISQNNIREYHGSNYDERDNINQITRKWCHITHAEYNMKKQKWSK